MTWSIRRWVACSLVVVMMGLLGPASRAGDAWVKIPLNGTAAMSFEVHAPSAGPCECVFSVISAVAIKLKTGGVIQKRTFPARAVFKEGQTVVRFKRVELSEAASREVKKDYPKKDYGDVSAEISPKWADGTPALADVVTNPPIKCVRPEPPRAPGTVRGRIGGKVDESVGAQ